MKKVYSFRFKSKPNKIQYKVVVKGNGNTLLLWPALPSGWCWTCITREKASSLLAYARDWRNDVATAREVSNV